MFIQIQGAYLELERTHSPLISKSESPSVTVDEATTSNKEDGAGAADSTIIDFGKMKSKCKK
jgi:hypothetical protein